MIKALFFDIDGTLVSFKTHLIPDDTVEALEAAHHCGVKIFIATGRPPMLIDNLGQIEHLIDGYVTTNGALCYANDISIHKTMRPDEVKSIKFEADRLGAMLITVGLKQIALSNPDEALMGQLQTMLNVPSIPECNNIDALADAGVIQMTAFVTINQEKQLLHNAPNCLASRWHPAFIDITASCANKASGITAIANKNGIDISEVMAFGDGGNDLSMLRAAGIGVAMGNSLNEVKEIADYVTHSVDNGGIASALRHFEVIR